MDKIKVKFIKAIFPYNEWDIGYLTPDRVEYNKEHLEVLDDTEPQNKMISKASNKVIKPKKWSH